MAQATVEEYITFSAMTQDEMPRDCRLPIADCRFSPADLRGGQESKIENRKSEIALRGVLAYPQEAAPELAVLLCSPHPHFAGDMNNNVICAVARRLAERAVVLRFDYRGVGDSEISLDPEVSVFDYWAQIEETKDYREPVRDVASAAQALREATQSCDVELCVVGYSFGAVTGMMFAQQTPDVRKMVAIAPPLGKVSFEFLSGGGGSLKGEAFGDGKPRTAHPQAALEDATQRVASLHLVGKRDFLYSDKEVQAYRKAAGPAAKVVVLENTDHFFRGDEEMLAQRVQDFLDEPEAVV